MGGGRYSARRENAARRTGKNPGGATSKRNAQTERESDLERLDRISEARAELQDKVNQIYRPGTENVWYDRTTGQEVAYSEVVAMVQRLNALNSEWERLIEKLG